MATLKVIHWQLIIFALFAFGTAVDLQCQNVPIVPRVLKLSGINQAAWLEAYLKDGMPTPTDELATLVLSNSAFVLPILERKIKEILNLKSPNQLFSNESADPQRVVDLAAATIEHAGDEGAIKQASKLMKIDERRFGEMVYAIMSRAANRGNAFRLAYSAFALHDSAVDKRVMAWAEEEFLFKDHRLASTRKRWAEAMVESYGGVPSSIQWTFDPIASRLKSEGDALLQAEMLRYTTDVLEHRKKK